MHDGALPAWEESVKIDLEGKVIVITGAAQGLGAEIARTAAGCGAEALFLTDRNAVDGMAVAQDLVSFGHRCAFHEADLAGPDAPREIIGAALERFGRIDCLVNAAGMTDRADFTDGRVETWDRLYAVNARAPFFLMQGAINDMLRRGSVGTILNILSMNAHCGAPDLAIYASTKGALSTLTRNAANAHLADRIRVNGINVGWCDTPAERNMQAVTLGKGDEWLAAAAQNLPLGRLLQMDEVARLAVFLLSDAAGLTTGALIDMEQAVVGAPAQL
ncbi:SDR family oxidoreductase [Hoeflea sp.]|uniref:SDR family oxidoreductase n=1 Tax=Hoeflea sp. TaxID=1940281 RepID=UPI003B01A848